MCCTYTDETLKISPKWVESGRKLDAIMPLNPESVFEKIFSHAGSA